MILDAKVLEVTLHPNQHEIYLPHVPWSLILKRAPDKKPT